MNPTGWTSLSLLALVLVVGFSNASDVDDKIKTLLEKYRGTLARGEWILPPLDPLVWDTESVHYANAALNVDANVTFDAIITGFADYEVVNVATTEDLQFEIGFRLKTSTAKGNWLSKGQFSKKLPVNGNGTYTGSVTEELLSFKGQIGTKTDGFMVLTKLNVDYNLDSMKITLHGLKGGPIYDKIISGIMSAGASVFVKSNLDWVDQYASDIFGKIFNPVLGRYTLDQLMDAINNA